MNNTKTKSPKNKFCPIAKIKKTIIKNFPAEEFIIVDISFLGDISIKNIITKLIRTGYIYNE